ncbi:MAG: hypothetical protein M3R38_04135 [Actinomycetota bacterium]|nr:hypothetical protein [Actinomycetota bacterium]
MSDPSNDWQSGGLSSPGVEGPLAEPEERFHERGFEDPDDHTARHDDLDFDDSGAEEEPTTDFSGDDDLLDEMEDLRQDNAATYSSASATAGKPRPRAADEEEELRGGEAPSGPFDALVLTLSRYWYVPVALFVIVLAFLGYRLLFSGGSGEEAQTAAAPQAPAQGEPAAQEETPTQGNTTDLPVTDTGIVLTEKEENGAYYVSAGEIDGKPFAWGGKTEDTEEGPKTTLEGPTAFEEVRSVELADGGSITPGSFGRAEPGQPILYVNFMRTTTGNGSYTNGEYHAVEEAPGEDRLILTGSFSDQVVKDNPRDEPDEIVRLYEEHPAGSTAEKAYKVGFKAKSDRPVPALIGWRPPAPSGEAE